MLQICSYISKTPPIRCKKKIDTLNLFITSSHHILTRSFIVKTSRPFTLLDKKYELVYINEIVEVHTVKISRKKFLNKHKNC